VLSDGNAWGECASEFRGLVFSPHTFATGWIEKRRRDRGLKESQLSLPSNGNPFERAEKSGRDSGISLDSIRYTPFGATIPLRARVTEGKKIGSKNRKRSSKTPSAGYRQQKGQ